MEAIYQDFSKDIEHLKSVLSLVNGIKLFAAQINDPKVEPTTQYLELAEQTYHLTREANYGLVFLPGTIVLYLGGRFEHFVKTVFEELSMSIAIKCKKFNYLPKEFKESLINFTSDVIKSPAKYGHGENGVKTFITNLSDNINGSDITDINSKCLSITSENMRPQILSDLFNRIGAREIWSKIGQQARLQTFFETADSAKAQKEATKFLDDFMNIRNNVAHPSGTFSWPDPQTVLKQIEYFEILGKLIVEISAVYETSIVAVALEKIQKDEEKASSQHVV